MRMPKSMAAKEKVGPLGGRRQKLPMFATESADVCNGKCRISYRKVPHFLQPYPQDVYRTCTTGGKGHDEKGWETAGNDTPILIHIKDFNSMHRGFQQGFS